MNFQEIITDVNILGMHYCLRDGFVFSSITHPANVYDAIVIKAPQSAKSVYPQVGTSSRSLIEHIEFINTHGIEKALIIADNIDFISSCPTLKYLSIYPSYTSGNGFDYSPLYEMPHIKSLRCATVYGKYEELSTSIDYLKIQPSHLESLDIIYTVGNTNYHKIETLKSLHLSGYKYSDLSNAFCSSVLDTFSICDCNIESLEGIQKSQKMQCLYLHFNRRLKDISALKNVKKTLKALRIENCPKIKDFSVLGELDNLELLELSGSNELPNLSFLNTMKNLKTFTFSMNVIDGNLSPCLGLSYVNSSRNRKHYNLKAKDLPKGKYVRGNETIEIWRRLE